MSDTGFEPVAGGDQQTAREPEPPTSLLLDGDTPRLAATTPTVAAHPGAAPVNVFSPDAVDQLDTGPALPVFSPVLAGPSAPVLPGLPSIAPDVSTPTPPPPAPMLPTAPTAGRAPSVDATAPSLPSAALAPPVPTSDAPPPAPPPMPVVASTAEEQPAPTSEAPAEHPMAHLMPTTKPLSEASKRAAELRAAKKAKGRRIKIALAVAFIVVAAVVGPPLARWLGDAINEAGDTSVEEPAD